MATDILREKRLASKNIQKHGIDATQSQSNKSTKDKLIGIKRHTK